MDEKRDMEALLVDVVAVHVASVLVEAFTVVPIQDKDRVLVKPQPLVLIEDVPQEGVQHAQAVMVAVELFILREVLVPVTVGDALVAIVPRTREVLNQERFVVPVRTEPPLARLQHDIFLVAEGVRYLVALPIHRLGRVELLIAEVSYDFPELIRVIGRRLEEDGAVALLLQQMGQARARDTARLELRALKENRLDSAVDRRTPLGGAGDDHVGPLGEEALLR